MVRVLAVGLLVLGSISACAAGASFDYYGGDPVTVGVFNNLTGAEVDGLILRFSGPLTPENAIGVQADMQLESNVDGQLRYSGLVQPEGMWEVDWPSSGLRLEYAAWLVDGVVVEEIWVHSPTAVASVIVESNMVSVSDAGSADPDGLPLARYLWQWSDGTLAEGVSATRSLAPGDYTVTLTVWDVDGNTGTRETAFTVGPTYTLTVDVIGGGTVTVIPHRAGYAYGDVVTLTPTAAPGWSFAGFDTNSPVTITGDTTVVATFTPDEYTLTINVVGDGSVAKDLDQPTYHYGDVVTLTPTAALGWSFAGFDTNSPVTITGDTTVVATFAQDEYALTVDIVGNGSVTKSPNQSTYHYGDVVTLNAESSNPIHTPFREWGGDLSGTTNPETVTITGSANVTALFDEVRVFDVYLVEHSGSSPCDTCGTVYVTGGLTETVTVHLGWTTLDYGTVLTIEAVPNPGYVFEYWSSLSPVGGGNPLTITLTEDFSIWAVFIDQSN